jgi:hypothetical protein
MSRRLYQFEFDAFDVDPHPSFPIAQMKSDSILAALPADAVLITQEVYNECEAALAASLNDHA